MVMEIGSRMGHDPFRAENFLSGTSGKRHWVFLAGFKMGRVQPIQACSKWGSLFELKMDSYVVILA